MGFVADSIGATIGATAAFILGRTVSLLNTLIPWFLLLICADMHAFFLLSLILLLLLFYYFLLFFNYYFLILKEIFEHGWMNIFLFELQNLLVFEQIGYFALCSSLWILYAFSYCIPYLSIATFCRLEDHMLFQS